MITINANTKISVLLKQHPDALDAIVSISPKFNKLRNPLLRKLMASRTTISMASKIGGCSVNDFFEKLKPLGFTVDKAVDAAATASPSPTPDFVKNVLPENIVELDVRPVLDSGKDPFNMIRQQVDRLKPQQVLKLINSFDPIPLIQILEKQGYQSWSDIVTENLVHTYFHKTEQVKESDAPQVQTNNEDWDSILKRFDTKLKTIDVRQLEMPLPMLTILDELDKLPDDNALYVYHKRIPVFLLPEVKERKFEYRIKELSDSEVHLLIFRP